MRPLRRDESTVHQPVLRHEVRELLALEPGLCVVDATVGAGGHSQEILNEIQPGGFLIGVDRDPMMLELAARTLGIPRSDVFLRQSSYTALPDILVERGISGADRILADLGLSSDQLSDVSRGFSFDADGPLDLRFDPTLGESASRYLQKVPLQELVKVFKDYGEEPRSRELAEAIVTRRRSDPITTSRELADVILDRVPRRRKTDRHPATRVFQALRIAVNNELQQVSEFVDSVLPQIVGSGGRAAVITFHSLEDRLVKRAFRNKSLWQPLTTKPVTASSIERRQNPRSRSAKLRVALRT